MSKQEAKIFIGGLSWETTDEKLRTYFENFGAVQEAFVSYDRNTGRPRGFGFVVFADASVADRVVNQPHTIDRREVEAKKALPKEESPTGRETAGPTTAQGQRTRKIFVGGLGSGVDEPMFRAFFARFGTVEDAVVMYDHENRRPRGFGFVTFAEEESVERVLALGAVQSLGDRPVEIKRAVPRDAMPLATTPPAGAWQTPFRTAATSPHTGSDFPSPSAPQFPGLAQFTSDSAGLASPISLLLANARAFAAQQQQLGGGKPAASPARQASAPVPTTVPLTAQSASLLCGTPPAITQRTPYSLQPLAGLSSPLSPRGDAQAPSLGQLSPQPGLGGRSLSSLQQQPLSPTTGLLTSFGSGNLPPALDNSFPGPLDIGGSPALATPQQQVRYSPVATSTGTLQTSAPDYMAPSEQLASLQARVASLTERFNLAGTGSSSVQGMTAPPSAESALPGSSIWSR